MIQEVKYNGYSASPADYESLDGDLAGVVGLVPEASALKPILPPATLFTLAEGQRVVYIHTTAAFKHYIIVNEQEDSDLIDVGWKGDEGNITTLISDIADLVEVNAIGNTLLVITEDAIWYFLWKDDSYILLGDHLPNVEVSFGLVGHPRLFSKSDESKKRFKVGFPNPINDEDFWNPFSDENKRSVTSAVMARLNKFIRQQSVEKGRFCLPFFVRYALRLYDGSLVGHSAPILMNPSTTIGPALMVYDVVGEEVWDDLDFDYARCDIMLIAADLDYEVVDLDGLQRWRDIIKSIDVFISKPIYTFDQNGEITRIKDNADYLKEKFIGRLAAKDFLNNVDEEVLEDEEENNKDLKGDDLLRGHYYKPENEGRVSMDVYGEYTLPTLKTLYSEWRYDRIYAMYFNSKREFPSRSFEIPLRSEEDIKDDMANTHSFFKLCSIEVEDVELGGGRKIIDIDNEYLGSLLTREAMTDDYLTHDRLVPSYVYPYNSRLNFSGVKRELFSGFPCQSMLAYKNKNYTFALGPKDSSNGYIGLIIEPDPYDNHDCNVTTYIKEDGRTYAVTRTILGYPLSNPLSKYRDVIDSAGNTTREKNKLSWGCYYFYPNMNAYKMVVTNNNREHLVIDLEPHPFLNGAYAVLSYEQIRNSGTNPTPQQGSREDAFVDMPNKIYTSEINNPFYFPLLGIVAIGSKRILGISSATKALSEGQFGQFPLYAFTEDGVWALEVSSTGSYSARQPITRDICINSESITQLDSAVLFASDRGIMLLSGSDSMCISEILDNKEPFKLSSLPHSAELVEMAGLLPANFEYLTFRDFIKECRMLYDYTNQHIIVFNPTCSYAYVYSLDSKAWGMMRSNISSGVNSYPEALAMTYDNTLVDFSKFAKTNDVKGVIITRPLKLGAINVQKTIDTIIQRGYFKKGHVRSAVYGSRDLQNWFLIATSQDHYLRGFRGTPYKYFRVMLLCNLDQDESIVGCSVQFTPKLINQPR